MKLFQFNRYYFFWVLLLFITEISIAVYFHDDFVRPYFGDFLVTILIYCAIKCLVSLPVLKVASISLLFCYAIEIAQYLQLATILGLQKSRPISIVLGSSFSWSDIIAYSCGFIFIMGIEKIYSKQKQTLPILKK